MQTAIANSESTLFPLAAVPHLQPSRNSHPGFALPTAALHPAPAFLSSTSQPACTFFYDRMAAGRLVGLDYFGARYFSGAQGRFTSPDPFNPILRISKREQFNWYISNPQNWNAYGYVWNNPLRYTDPNGENVYVVLYTTGNSKGDDEIRRAALTKANEIRHSKGFSAKNDTVLVRGVGTKQDFSNALTAAGALRSQYGDVQQLNMFSHAGARDGPVFHGGPIEPTNPHGATQFSQSELGSLPTVNWTSTATANFYGCNTTTFAGMFAGAEHVRSFGTADYAYFSARPDRMSRDRGGNLYLIAPYFGQYMPNIFNYTRPMEGHDPQ